MICGLPVVIPIFYPAVKNRILGTIWGFHAHRIATSFYAVVAMKKRYLIPAAVLGAVLLCGGLLYLFAPQLFVSSQSHAKFEQFLNEFFRTEISGSTLSMHYTITNPESYGISGYTVSFGDASADGRARELSYLKDTKKSLKAFSYQTLSKSDQFTYDLLMDTLDSAIALADYELYEEPFTPNNGVHSQLPVLLAEYPFYSRTDVEDYLALLGQVDVYFSQLLDFEAEKAAAGYFMSDDQCELVLEACEKFLENPNENVLLRSFENRVTALEGLTETEQQSYIEKNREMFWNHVVPAYQDVVRRLTALLGCGRNAWGLCNYADGAVYYELLVHSDTGTSESMEELFEKIAAARDADLTVCTQVVTEHPEYASGSYNYDWTFADETAMLDALETAICADFPAISDASYRLNYVEESLQDSLAPAFYITAPIDNCSNNCIYVNPAKNYSNISYFTTLAHEGFPGHLYQTVMSYSYGLAPVRAILDYPGYTEGWATYVEMMSYHYAGLEEPLATLLAHNQSATLSLYASSDIGIHYYGWETAELAEFWGDYGITDATVLESISELILAAPGNYLKYYVGYLKFEELREEMAQTYGDDFSLVDFHEALLMMGPAQFDLLREYFPVYYASVRSSM
jgi:uncharacterized protein (DUF885 family)